MIPSRPLFILLAGLVAASTAATFVRLAQEAGMPSLVLAAGRLVVATAVLAPLALARHHRAYARLSVRDWCALAAAGVLLGVHFATWISSLEYTTVLATTVFGSTGPIFVALLSLPVLGERVSRVLAGGIALTFAGGVLIGMSGDPGTPSTRPDALLGNCLALVAALAFALYLLIGRRFRATMHVVPYVAAVYGFAAVAVLVVCLARGEALTGYSVEAWSWLLAVGLVPQLLGHSSFNYALGHMNAAYVGLVTRLEPLVSVTLAGVFLGEWPGLLALTGGAVVLAGVLIPSADELRRSARARARTTQSAEPESNSPAGNSTSETSMS